MYQSILSSVITSRIKCSYFEEKTTLKIIFTFLSNILVWQEKKINLGLNMFQLRFRGHRVTSRNLQQTATSTTKIWPFLSKIILRFTHSTSNTVNWNVPTDSTNQMFATLWLTFRLVIRHLMERIFRWKFYLRINIKYLEMLKLAWRFRFSAQVKF